MSDHDHLDIAILGGGISGIYILYQLIQKYKKRKNTKEKKEKKNSKIRIHLYERNNYFGGRIHTFQKKIEGHTHTFEAGAARLCKDKHLRFYRLISDLHLKKYLVPGSANIQFIPSSRKYQEDPLYASLSQKSPYDFIQKAIRKSANFSKSTLMKYSFIDFIKKKKILKSEEAEYLQDAFGYSGEIESMNAYNALHMFKTDLNKKYSYYSLSCGLSHVIQKMIAYIQRESKKVGFEIVLHSNCEVTNVKKIKSSSSSSDLFQLSYFKKGNKSNKNRVNVFAKRVIFAIQKDALLHQPILRPYRHLLNSVSAKALCRIYMIFKQEDRDWMADLSKITTNSHNRYMIPLDKKHGSVMISYTDGKYANYLQEYYQTYGKRKLISYILDSWSSTLNIHIPKPLFTEVCYWKEGIAMWKPGKNSLEICRKIRNPIHNLYIVGENYSLNQAWIEGALQTCDAILPKIRM